MRLKQTVLLTAEQIGDLVTTLAKQIDRCYGVDARFDTPKVHLLVVLDAAFMFAADLARKLTVPHTIGFVRATSYKGTKRAHKPQISINHANDLVSKNILIVDTIVDSGATVTAVANRLDGVAETIAVASLLERTGPNVPSSLYRFTGLVLTGNEFVIGYGMDFEGRHRSLSCIYNLDAPL